MYFQPGWSIQTKSSIPVIIRKISEKTSHIPILLPEIFIAKLASLAYFRIAQSCILLPYLNDFSSSNIKQDKPDMSYIESLFPNEELYLLFFDNAIDAEDLKITDRNRTAHVLFDSTFLKQNSQSNNI